MTLRLSNIPRHTHLGYNAIAVARTAAACLQCFPPAPCTRACPRGSDIPSVTRFAGQAACEGLALTRWFWDDERLEAARITDPICESYA